MKSISYIILVAVIGAGAFTYFSTNSKALYQITQKDNKQILVPLPDFLDLLHNKQVSTLSLWLPKKAEADTNAFAGGTKPDIQAKSALVFDITAGRSLFAKDQNKRLPMASLTKIMTAIVGLEHQKKDNEYKVSKSDLVGEDSMGVSDGEILSLDDLLYGLFLNSGNDAAETIASNFPSGRSGFIVAMNQKVKSLGLFDTNFTNPTGLEGDGDQYTTAYDLLVITNYAISNFPKIIDITSTVERDIPQTKNHKEFYLQNETNLITSYPGVKGVKTGYTPEAGLCLVTYLEYRSHRIIGILLGSENRRLEMKELLDYGLEAQGITPPPHD